MLCLTPEGMEQVRTFFCNIYQTITLPKIFALPVFSDQLLVSFIIRICEIIFYYRSWQLRGDHPDLYTFGELKWHEKVPVRSYDNYRVSGGLVRYSTRHDKLCAYREIVFEQS